MNSKTLQPVGQKFIFFALLFALITNFSFPSIFTQENTKLFLALVVQSFALYYLSNDLHFSINFLDIIINLMSAYGLCILIIFGIEFFNILYFNYDLLYYCIVIYVAINVANTFELLNLGKIVKISNSIVRIFRLFLCVTVIFYYCFNGYTLIYSNNFSYPEISNTSSTSDIATIELTYEQALYDLQDELTEENWSSLNLDEKVDLLQEIAICESLYLGIANFPTVYYDETLFTTQGGYYSSISNEIYVNDFIMTTFGLNFNLETVLHEVFHAYQHELCDTYVQLDADAKKLYIFDDVEQYIYEFTNYIDGENNYEEYYNQLCESSAREHATERIGAYYDEQ